MGDYETKAIEELKTVVLPAVEAALVKEVSGKEFACWGWSVRITRLPKTTPPATPAEPPKTADTSAPPSEAGAV